MLGLMPEGEASTKSAQSRTAGSLGVAGGEGFLQPLESLLPLRMDWAYQMVRSALASQKIQFETRDHNDHPQIELQSRDT